MPVAVFMTMLMRLPVPMLMLVTMVMLMVVLVLMPVAVGMPVLVRVLRPIRLPDVHPKVHALHRRPQTALGRIAASIGPSSAPRSSRAPSHMSPATPAKQSTCKCIRIRTC